MRDARHTSQPGQLGELSMHVYILTAEIADTFGGIYLIEVQE